MIRADSASNERRLLDLEELCMAFEKEWRPDAGLIESYLARVKEAQRPQLAAELIAVECELLQARGESSRCAAYLRKFPEWQKDIDSACQQCLAAQREPSTQKTNEPKRVGDYHIVREIGRGGMGVVYEAEEEGLGRRRVAVKTLTAHPLHLPEVVGRFQRESRAVAGLQHANIVEIYDTGQQDGMHYYAMQLVEGKSLSHVIAELREQSPEAPAENAVRLCEQNSQEKQPKLDAVAIQELSDPLPAVAGWKGIPQEDCHWPKVAVIGLQVARALTYAHGRGVLHRDIKPANLLLDRGTIVVTDFGLAKLNEEGCDVTRTGDVVGTLRYLPPEALNGHWDERGDVYALGLTLYELLTLRPAFPETDRLMLLDKIARGDPPPGPRSIDPSIPLDLDTLVMKAIARQPADRYQSAGELAGDLTRLLDGQPIVARRPTTRERLWNWSRRHPTLATFGAVVTLLAAVGLPAAAMLWWSA